MEFSHAGFCRKRQSWDILVKGRECHDRGDILRLRFGGCHLSPPTIRSWTRSRNGSSSVALSRNVGPAGDGRSVGNNRPRSWMACGRRCVVAAPTVQRTGSRSLPIASASSVSRAVVVVRHAKRYSDTGIPPLTPEFLPKRCSDTGIPLL